MIQENYPLSGRNTLGLHVQARYFASARSVEEIREALRFARDRDLPVIVLGGGSNTVLSKDVDGLVLAVDLEGMRFTGREAEVAAGENWHEFVLKSLDQNLFGLENLSLIPGNAGAAPIQNIGAYGEELEHYFVSLDALDRETLELVTMDRTECRFGYRNSVFKGELKDRLIIVHIRLVLDDNFTANLTYQDLRAEVEASVGDEPTAIDVSDAVCRLRRRKLPDPEQVGNAGSFFKNPEVSESYYRELLKQWPGLPSWPTSEGVKLSAGWMIDQLGLKGSAVGDARVSSKHALVLVNSGRASGTDVLELAGRVQRAVKDGFGLELEIEPVIYN